jgi:hypothetical protein
MTLNSNPEAYVTGHHWDPGVAYIVKVMAVQARGHYTGLGKG